MHSRRLFCKLDSLQFAGRANQWRTLLLSSDARAELLDGGVTFTFRDSGIRTELERLIQLEQQCCPWMRLDLRDDGAVLTLSIRAMVSEDRPPRRRLLQKRHSSGLMHPEQTRTSG
jgi:hypothetical protein